MRFLGALILVVLSSSSFAADDYTVGVAAKSNGKLRSLLTNNIMAPSEGIAVTVVPSRAIAAPDATLTATINRLQTIAKSLSASTAKIQAQLNDPNVSQVSVSDINEVATLLTDIHKIRREDTASPSLKRFAVTVELNVARRSRNAKANQLAIVELGAVSEALGQTVDDLQKEILSRGITVRVQAFLSRNSDMSRVSDQQFLSGPDLQALQALQSLRDQLRGTGGQPLNPNTLAKAVLDKFKAQYIETYKKLGDDLQGKIDRLKSDAGQMEAQLGSTPAGAQFKLFEDELVAQVAGVQNVLDQANNLRDLLAQPDSQANGLSDADLLAKAVTAFDTLASSIGGIPQALDSLSKELNTFVQALPQNLKDITADAEQDLQKLLGEAETSLKALSDDVKTDVYQTIETQLQFLNLVQKMDLIDQTTAEGPDGSVDLPNENKTLSGMKSPLRSYDELLIRVSVKAAADSDFKTVGPGNGYRIGVLQDKRWDNLYVLAFAPRSQDTKRWDDALTFAKVFKLSSYNRPYSSEFWNVGLGFSFSVLNQSGDNTRQIGTGIAASLFSDVIVGGYGYNWSGKTPYWYVGYRFRL